MSLGNSRWGILVRDTMPSDNPQRRCGPNTTNSWTAKPDKGHALDISKTQINQEIERMKKGFLNNRGYYAYNHVDENTFAYNNHEEEADDTFGYNLQDLNDPMMMLSRYTDLADFNFFNRFHDDQDFL
ncbi:hypothetical protein Tco_1398873 [Tanacetum coccineum]